MKQFLSIYKKLLITNKKTILIISTCLSLLLIITIIHYRQSYHLSNVITEDNFRDKVEITEYTDKFYLPKKTKMWSRCMQAIMWYDETDIAKCKLEKFEPKHELDIKVYGISFDSELPLNPRWQEIVISEFLHQEGYEFYSVLVKRQDIHNYGDIFRNKRKYRKKNFTQQNDIERQTLSQLSWKDCEHNIHPHKQECKHHMYINIVAYNDIHALENGVAHNLNIEDDGVYMYYDVYNIRQGSYSTTDFPDYAGKYPYHFAENIEPAQPYKYKYSAGFERRYGGKYKIKTYDQFEIAERNDSKYYDSTRPIFDQEMYHCQEEIKRQHNGRFFKTDEKFCSCKAKILANTHKKIKHPYRHYFDILEYVSKTCK